MTARNRGAKRTTPAPHVPPSDPNHDHFGEYQSHFKGPRLRPPPDLYRTSRGSAKARPGIPHDSHRSSDIRRRNARGVHVSLSHSSVARFRACRHLGTPRPEASRFVVLDLSLWVLSFRPVRSPHRRYALPGLLADHFIAACEQPHQRELSLLERALAQSP